MKSKNILLLFSMCMLLSACSDIGNSQVPEASVVTSAEYTEITAAEQISGTETDTEATASEIEVNITETESAAAETEAEITEAETEAASETESDMEEEYIAEASRLMGALDYIDCIGGGSIPKDENDIKEIDGRQFARVYAQFENTADLEEYIKENLSDSLIQSRYSHITGGEEPYYIDADGALYGYVTAKGCGFSWIIENDEPVISIADTGEGCFTAITKFDNFGGECEMTLNIIFDEGLWKISSISYDGMTF